MYTPALGSDDSMVMLGALATTAGVLGKGLGTPRRFSCVFP